MDSHLPSQIQWHVSIQCVLITVMDVLSGFLHAHISYPWEKTDACLILLSTRRDHFFSLSAVKVVNQLLMYGTIHLFQEDIVKRVESNPTLHSNLVKSLEKPITFDITQVNFMEKYSWSNLLYPFQIGTGNDLLWYFVYKNRRSQQMCLRWVRYKVIIYNFFLFSGARIPFISRDERRRLNRSIASSSFIANSNPIIRIAFVQRKDEAILIRYILILHNARSSLTAGQMTSLNWSVSSLLW